jgi:hypothetical protein
MSNNGPEAQPVYHQKEDVSSLPLRSRVNEKPSGSYGEKLQTSAALIVTSQVLNTLMSVLVI